MRVRSGRTLSSGWLVLLGPEGNPAGELAARMPGRGSGREDRKEPAGMNVRGRTVHVPVLCIWTSSMMVIRMALMRTTLTIEPDVEQVLLREVRRTDKSMKAVVNDALRVGLGMRSKPPWPRRFKVQPHAFAFKPGIDVDRLNQLVDELEADERARQPLR